MRVAIDLSGLARPGSGSDTYFRQLALALAREIPPTDDLVGFLNRFGASSQDTELPPLRVLNPRWPWRVLGTLWGWGILSVDRLIEPVDVFHANDWTCPPLRKGHLVATVFDLAFERYPELYPPDILRLHRRQLDCVRRRASGVVAISAHTKEDLRAAWGAERTPEIRVIHPAGDPIYAEPRNLEAERQLRTRLGLPVEYLLYLGTSAPRKNLPRLVRAYALARQAGVRSPLVIAGSTGLVSGMPIHGAHSWDAPQVRDEILARGLEESVLVTGHLTRADAAHLMRGARAFVFPSLYEGFGLPVLEAMSAGVPVIASSNSALPEVAGDAALYVDAGAEEAIADAIARVDGAEELRRDLAARGLRRAQEFSWAATARKTLAFYRDLVGGAAKRSPESPSIRRFFDTMAAGRDAMIQRDHIYRFEQAARQRAVVSLLRLEPRLSVLDLGCGNARDLACLLAELPEARLMGVDLSFGMIHEGRMGLGARGAHVGLAVGDAARLPVRSESFDRVVCSEVIEHVPAWRDVVAEAARVLKRGGLLVLTTPNRRGIYGLDKATLGRVETWLRPATHPYDEWKIPAEVETAIVAAGLRISERRGICYLPGYTFTYRLPAAVKRAVARLAMAREVDLGRRFPRLGYMFGLSAVKE